MAKGDEYDSSLICKQISNYNIYPLFSTGVDPLLWQQAKLDNPDPDKYIPVPMIGFKELQRRLRHQAEQTKVYQSRMDVRMGKNFQAKSFRKYMILRPTKIKFFIGVTRPTLFSAQTLTNCSCQFQNVLTFLHKTIHILKKKINVGDF